MLVAVIFFFANQIQKNSNVKEKVYLKITVEGEEYGRYPLNQDQVISIGHTNTCEIKDGKVSMTHANCPDKLCLTFKKIGNKGGTIVCLPNQVVLEIVTDQAEVDSIAS